MSIANCHRRGMTAPRAHPEQGSLTALDAEQPGGGHEYYRKCSVSSSDVDRSLKILQYVGSEGALR